MIPTWMIISLAVFVGGWVGWFLFENARGRPVAGLLLGIWPCPVMCIFLMLLGLNRLELLYSLIVVPVGWLQVLLLNDHRITCLVCGAKILPDESVCLQCGHEPPPP